MSLYVNQEKLEPAPDPETKSSETKTVTAAGSSRSPQFTYFPIPQELVKDRRLVVDWSDPKEPRTPGLRFGPYVAEVWLLRRQ